MTDEPVALLLLPHGVLGRPGAVNRYIGSWSERIADVND
jgi:hypothetical protein